MNVKSLQKFFLTSLYPEVSTEKVHQYLPRNDQDENRKLMSYDSKSVEDLFRDLWKSTIRRKFIIIGILKALGIATHFFIPFLLDLLTNNFKLTDYNERVTILLFFTVTSEQASWIYSGLVIINMIIGCIFGSQYTYQINKLKYQAKTVLQYIIYRKLLEGKPKDSGNKEEDKTEGADINNLVTADCDTFLGTFWNFHEAWACFVSLAIALTMLFFKVFSFPLKICLL